MASSVVSSTPRTSVGRYRIRWRNPVEIVNNHDFLDEQDSDSEMLDCPDLADDGDDEIGEDTDNGDMLVTEEDHGDEQGVEVVVCHNGERAVDERKDDFQSMEDDEGEDYNNDDDDDDDDDENEYPLDEPIPGTIEVDGVLHYIDKVYHERDKDSAEWRCVSRGSRASVRANFAAILDGMTVEQQCVVWSALHWFGCRVSTSSHTQRVHAQLTQECLINVLCEYYATYCIPNILASGFIKSTYASSMSTENVSARSLHDVVPDRIGDRASERRQDGTSIPFQRAEIMCLINAYLIDQDEDLASDAVLRFTLRACARTHFMTAIHLPSGERCTVRLTDVNCARSDWVIQAVICDPASAFTTSLSDELDDQLSHMSIEVSPATSAPDKAWRSQQMLIFRYNEDALLWLSPSEQQQRQVCGSSASSSSYINPTSTSEMYVGFVLDWNAQLKFDLANRGQKEVAWYHDRSTRLHWSTFPPRLGISLDNVTEPCLTLEPFDRHWLITDVFHPVMSVERACDDAHDVMHEIECLHAFPDALLELICRYAYS